ISPPRRAPWLGLFLSALSGLVLFAIGLGVQDLIADLYALAPWLGWVGLALAALALLSFVALIAREARGIFRERRIEHLREAAIDALAVKDHAGAKAVVAELVALYAARSRAGAGSERLKALSDEI